MICDPEKVSPGLFVILRKCLRRKTAFSFIVLILMLTFNELLTIENWGRKSFHPPATASLVRNADTGEMLPYAIKDHHQPQGASDSPSTHYSSLKQPFDMLKHAAILLS